MDGRGKSRQGNLMWENLNEIKVCCVFTAFSLPLCWLFLSCFTAFCSNNTINKNEKEGKCEARGALARSESECLAFYHLSSADFPSAFNVFEEIIKLKLRSRIDEWTKHMAGTLIISMRSYLGPGAGPERKGFPAAFCLLFVLFIGNFHMVTRCEWSCAILEAKGHFLGTRAAQISL